MGSSDQLRPAGRTVIQPGSVKIDGFRTVEHALLAAGAGAEMIGVIFAPARRQVTIQVARQISDAVRAAASGVLVVGVFVNASADEINASARAARLDLVQLHGDESPELLANLDLPAIKAFRALPGEGASAFATRISPYLSGPVPPVAVLIDGYDPMAHGGTGVRADWAVVRGVSDRLDLPVGLAGGLTPANVGGAIRTVRPLMVDISSGVEVDGVKDETLIRQFIAAADAGYAAVAISSGSGSTGVDRLPRR